MPITLNGSGSITGLSSGAGVAATALSGQVPDANAPSGSVIQVVQVAKSDTFSTTIAKGVWSDVTGYTASITPLSASSKILVTGQIMGNSGGYPGYFFVRLVRNSTPIGVGDASGSRGQVSSYTQVDASGVVAMATMPFSFLDSPNTTSATTYKVQIAQNTSSATDTVYINRSISDTDDFNRPRGISIITLMEIAA